MNGRLRIQIVDYSEPPAELFGNTERKITVDLPLDKSFLNELKERGEFSRAYTVLVDIAHKAIDSLTEALYEDS